MFSELKPLQHKAVLLVARADKTIEGIAADVGITRKTLDIWIRQPVFAAAVEAETQRLKDAIRAEGIANRQNRLDAVNHRHALMEQVIAARAEANRRRALAEDRDDVTFAEYAAAGAHTGLMVHTTTYLKDGTREEWTVDTGLLKEMREHEKQAAQDIGQWTEKREVTGKGGAPLVPESEPFDYDAYARAFTAIVGTAGADPLGPDGDSESLDSAAANG